MTKQLEVTEEMISAGVDASFEECVWDEDTREECVRVIVSAALRTIQVKKEAA